MINSELITGSSGEFFEITAINYLRLLRHAGNRDDYKFLGQSGANGPGIGYSRDCPYRDRDTRRAVIFPQPSSKENRKLILPVNFFIEP